MFNEMKKLLLVAFMAFSLYSCDIGEEGDVAGYSLLEIESVDLDTIVSVNQPAEFLVTYRRPTDCHYFDGFIVDSEGYESTISIRAVQLNETDCMDDSMNTFVVPLEFRPEQIGDYVFRFYRGTEDDVPQFLEYTVVVE